MPTLSELKASSPAYSSIPDDEFARRVYEKHYKGRISFDEFLQRTGQQGKTGVTRSERQAQMQALAAPIAEEKERIGTMEDIGRTLALGGRSMIEGLASIPDIVAAPAAQLINKALPEKYHQGGFVEGVDTIMDKLGVPEAETPAERLSADVTRGITGAAGGLGVANTLARTGRGAAQLVGQSLQQRPLAQLVGGATGGGAAGLAREAGAGPAGQIAAGLVGAAAPGVAAARPVSGAMLGRQQAVAEAERMGINLAGEPGEQVMQLRGPAKELRPEIRGEAMEGVQSALQAEREAARIPAGQAFREIGDANVRSGELGQFSRSLRETMDQFDLGSKKMSEVGRRIKELDDMASRGKGEGMDPMTLSQRPREVGINDLVKWRQRLTAMKPERGSREEAAVTALKRQYDNFIQQQATEGLMTGDPKAVDRLMEAIGGWAKFKAKFDADKTVRDIIQGASKGSPATPETMRQWVFGMSQNGAKPQAGAVVKRMNDILGEDSPQMRALGNEIVFDMLQPLMKDVPDVKAFLNRYDNYFLNSPTLKRELFPEGIKELDSLVGVAKGISKRPGSSIPPPDHPSNRQLFGTMQRMVLARVTGHQLGEASAQMSLGQQAMSRIEGALLLDRLRSSSVGKIAKENILREWLGGYDPGQSMFPQGLAIQQAAQAQQATEGEPLELGISGGNIGPPVSDQELERLRAGNLTGGQ